MKQTFKTLAPGVIAVGVVVIVVLWVANFFNLDQRLERNDTIRQSGAVEIFEIKPVNIDCRAVVRASIPVKGESQYIVHTPLGSKTLNTDTIWLTAIGDVDVCFPPEASEVVKQADGSWLVTIDSSKTVFNRPRVDALATGNSVDYEDGAGRDIMSAVPLVNAFIDTNAHELTLEAVAFAQSLIASSECMAAAWPPVQEAVTAAYAEQAALGGLSADQVTVVFKGAPFYAQYKQDIDTSVFGDGVEFEVEAGGINCSILPEAFQPTAADGP